jgi:hypothetical protein
MNRIAPTTGPAKARSRAVSRVTEIAVDAALAPSSSRTSSTSTAKPVPIRPCRTILPAALRPRFCFLVIFLKSSTKPTSPMPSISPSAASPETVTPP